MPTGNPATGGEPRLQDDTPEVVARLLDAAFKNVAHAKLPPDLKKVIDANSGMVAASLFGRAMDEGDKVGLGIAQKAGNRIIMLDAVETQTWRRTAAAVRGIWYKEVAAKGIDGPKLAAEAEALIAKHSK